MSHDIHISKYVHWFKSCVPNLYIYWQRNVKLVIMFLDRIKYLKKYNNLCALIRRLRNIRILNHKYIFLNFWPRNIPVQGWHYRWTRAGVSQIGFPLKDNFQIVQTKSRLPVGFRFGCSCFDKEKNEFFRSGLAQVKER
jgi:hypothetical protein